MKGQHTLLTNADCKCGYLKYENITVRNDTDYELDIAQELGTFT